jgi:hypothetical protein
LTKRNLAPQISHIHLPTVRLLCHCPTRQISHLITQTRCPNYNLTPITRSKRHPNSTSHTHFHYEPRKEHAIEATTSGNLWAPITNTQSLVPFATDMNLLAMTS